MARLLDAGREVLAERGYHGTRIDDVVQAANTSHGTFYLYFANKEDLFRALATECTEEMTGLVAQLGPVGPGQEGYDVLRHWLVRFREGYGRYGAVIRAWMESQVGDEELLAVGRAAFDHIARSLAARIEDAGAAHVADPRLAAIAMLAMIERLSYVVLARGVDVDEDGLLDTLATMLHRGFFNQRPG